MKAAVAAVVAMAAGVMLVSGTAAQGPAPAAVPAVPAVQTSKIGYIDVQRVLARSAAGVAAREQLEKERAAIQKDMDGRRVELEKKEGQLLQKVLQEVGGVIEKVGKEKNYYMIVEKRNAGVLYASNDADLTDEIIRAYDRDAGGKKK